MRLAITAFAAVVATAVVTLLLPSPELRADWEVEQTRTLEEVLAFAAGAEHRLLVDNVLGSITVSGHDRDDVRMVVRETIRGHAAADLERARREVELAITSAEDGIRIFVDGPFRRADGSIEWRGDLGYEVVYDFELEVPVTLAAVLKTIHQGEIEARRLRGRLEISNVNGGITMEDVAGAGSIRTVNGEVAVSLVESPREGWQFETVNGDVDVGFPADLSADLRFRTFNGEVYTDFDFRPRRLDPPEPEHRDGRTIYRSAGHGVRIAAGNPSHPIPEMAFATLNGNIYIRNHQR